MKPLYLKIITVIAIIVAVAFVILGLRTSHKVYVTKTKEITIDMPGIPQTQEIQVETFEWISESDLVVDSTFTGTIREGDKLYSTYERAEPVGKRQCPT